MIRNPQSLTEALQGGTVVFEFKQVLFSSCVWVNEKGPRGFQIFKHGWGFEFEFQLGGIEELKEQHFMSTSSQRAQIRFQSVQGRKEIGKQEHETSLPYDLDNPFERSRQIGNLATQWLFEREHELPQVTSAVAGREVLAALSVKGKQAHGVALQVKERGQRGSEVRRVSR